MIIYKPNFDFEEFKDGMNQFITRLENNKQDWVIREWTRKAIFHYLVDYYEQKGIEKEQVACVYNKDGYRHYDEVNYKFIVGLSMRLYENAINLGLEAEYIEVYKRAFDSFLAYEISLAELQRITLSAS